MKIYLHKTVQLLISCKFFYIVHVSFFHGSEHKQTWEKNPVVSFLILKMYLWRSLCDYVYYR